MANIQIDEEEKEADECEECRQNRQHHHCPTCGKVLPGRSEINRMSEEVREQIAEAARIARGEE
jgi:hypothetical protein